MIDNNLNEHYIKLSDSSMPTCYICRPIYVTSGLFWYFAVFAGHIRYALSKGWTPVVDMQNYNNPYLPPEKLGKENSWEYYFEQPLRIGLEEAYNFENVILSSVNPKMRPSPSMQFTDKVLADYKILVKKGLLKVKDEIAEEVESVKEKLFSSMDRVLGVKLRGTDYVANKPKWHYIPPPLSLVADTIRTKMLEWNCSKIFLATEDKNIFQFFKDTFGDLVVNFDKEFVNYTEGKLITQCKIDRENDLFLQGKEYLIEMLLLTKCNSLIMARSFGTLGVMILGGHFDNTYLFDLGKYGVP